MGWDLIFQVPPTSACDTFRIVNPDQSLMDQLYREKVLRARKLTSGERLNEALELSVTHYGKDDPELRRRLAIVRAMEERGCYGPPQPRL